MKAYVATTGTVFGLLAIMHVLRLIVEGPRMARDPVFIIFTIAAIGLCIWAFYLLRLLARARDL